MNNKMYIAIDVDGAVFSYTARPFYLRFGRYEGWVLRNRCGPYNYIGKVNPPKNPDQTLLEFEV